MNTSPVSAALEKLGIPHRVFRHKHPVESLEQAARERGQQPSQIVRSILFRVRDGEYALALVAGPHQVSWKTLRKILGRSRISMATEDEVLKVTGYCIGTVGPFGLQSPTRIVIDKSVIQENEISIGSGIRGVAVILKSEDLVKGLSDAEVVDLLERGE